MNTPSRLPLAFGAQIARVDQDPDALAQLISRAVPLRDLTPRGSLQTFVHKAANVRAAQLEITAAAHSPLRGANHAQAKVVFTLPILGEKRFLIDGRPFLARAGHNALVLPGADYTVETSVTSGVMFSVCPRELATAASGMAGPDSGLRFAPIHRPLELLESHPRQGNLLALLRRSLRLIDLVRGNSPRLPQQLGLDDKILRLMALLIYPQLMGLGGAQLEHFGPRETSSFEALMAAIRADLLADWTLSRMERQTALSRFQLRRQFQATFGCGPLDWLRQQRLCWARQRLDEPNVPPLAQLALQCGYSDLAMFREAFENRFQIQPEHLLPCS